MTIDALDCSGSPATPSDNDVAAEVLRGNPAVFELLVRRHNQRLFRVGMSYLRHADQVEDAMQNTYLKAYQHLGSFHQDAAFSTWLTRIMINECLMALRRRKGSGEGEAADQQPEPSTGGDETRRQASAHEIKTLLEGAISQLPEPLRVVFMFREIQHMNTEGTAAALGLSIQNVRIRLHRARELLKERLLASAEGVELFTFGNSRCQQLTQRVMDQILQWETPTPRS